MSEESGPTIRVGKLGSTFEWTQERGWRVTRPSDLVLPPWDLCGFDRDFDPYTMDWFGPVGWHGYQLEREAERAVADPNEADGRWGELVFMPRDTERIPNGVETVELGDGGVGYRALWLEVPAYLNVREALALEQALREERRPISGVSSAHGERGS